MKLLSKFSFSNFFLFMDSPTLEKLYFFQTMGPEEGMRKVLAGDFSYIHNYYVMRILLATHQQGAATIPVHISTTKYPLFPGNTWAFRCGGSQDSILYQYSDTLLCRTFTKLNRISVVKMILYFKDAFYTTYCASSSRFPQN